MSSRAMKTIAAFIISFLFSLSSVAQNRIDELIENLSTSGNTSFTSIVTRNKRTKAVEKVVKYAEITGSARKFVETFEAECNKHDYLEKTEGDITTINITIDSKKQKRIYIIQYEKKVKHNATVTVIIHYK